MQDILGRELKENDLVLGMVISRNSDGIRFGVYNGTSVNWRNSGASTMCNLYLIENPSEKELKIKQGIIDKLAKEKQEKEAAEAKRKALKRIPTKELIIGETYEDDRGYRMVYLGKGSVSNSYTREFEQGYIYLTGSYSEYDADNDCFYYLPSVTALKNPKKLVKVSEEKLFGYTFDKQEFVLKGSRKKSMFSYGYDREKSLKFKLGE